MKTLARPPMAANIASTPSATVGASSTMNRVLVPPIARDASVACSFTDSALLRNTLTPSRFIHANTNGPVSGTVAKTEKPSTSR